MTDDEREAFYQGIRVVKLDHPPIVKRPPRGVKPHQMRYKNCTCPECQKSKLSSKSQYLPAKPE